MGEMYLPVAVPCTLGNHIVGNFSVGTCMNVVSFNLMGDPENESLFPHSEIQVASRKLGDGDNEEEGCSSGDLGNEASSSAVMLASADDNRPARLSSVDMDVVMHESEGEGSSSLEGEGDPALDSSCSLSVVSDTSSLCGDDLLSFEILSEIGASLMEVDLVSKRGDAGGDSSIGNAVSVGVEEIVNEGSVKSSAAVVIQLDKASNARASRSIFEVDCVPLWGFTSLCGRRPEMEDAVATIPRFMQIPVRMLIGDHVFDAGTSHLSHLSGHFFGVYDGHGGSQVTDFIVFHTGCHWDRFIYVECLRCWLSEMSFSGCELLSRAYAQSIGRGAGDNLGESD